MSLSADEIIDRRALRKRVTFWRIAALVLAILTVLAIAGAAGVFSKFNSTNTAHIARVDIEGVITNDRPLLDMLKKIKDDDNVEAMILNISSPGGTTVGGEAIYEAVRAISETKPVVTSVGTLAASAGYMIASASDHIIARRSSIVGSIGVIFQYADASQLLDKIGVKMNEIKSAPLKAEPSPFHPASEEAKAMIDRMIQDSFRWFVDIVTERRPLDRQKVLELADGSIFTGSQSLANGLIDQIGDEETARKWLVENKEISDDNKVIAWKPARPNTSPFALSGSMSRTAGWIMEKLGFPNDTATIKAIKQALPERLFLDGLLSIMQTK